MPVGTPLKTGLFWCERFIIRSIVERPNPTGEHARAYRLWPLVSGLICVAACDAAPNPPNPEIKPASITAPDWTIKRRYTAHHALVVDVECADRERAVAIAKSLVEPVEGMLTEALVFVRPPKGMATRWTRRVQWLRADGQYRVMDY